MTVKLYILIFILVLTSLGCSSQTSSKPVNARYKDSFGPENVTSLTLSETFDIPNYAGNVGNIFQDIGIHYGNNSLQLANSRGMASFPLMGETLDFKSGFTAPCDGYDMIAFSGSPVTGQVTALDKMGKRIITDKPYARKLPLPPEITSPTGMCDDGNYLWICDSSSKVFKIQVSISLSRAELVDTIQSPLDNPTGIAWDGWNLWICSKTSIVRIDKNGGVLYTFDCPYEIDGICIVKNNLWAIASGKSVIYRFGIE